MEPTAKRFRKRDSILTYLRHTDTHPSAEMVYAQLKQQIPDLSLGTVYRNLSLFKQQGLIRSLGTVNGVERFDGRVEPHVHFICTGCGCVRDLHNLQIPGELSTSAEEEAHAHIEECQLTFTGHCEQCG